MGRDHRHDMRIGLVGILAGAALTVSAYDGLIARTAPAAEGISVRHQVSQVLGIELSLPCFAENRAVRIILKVFADVTGMSADEENDD
ncbi:hypothetical protein [Aquisalinus flavus]|uniref:Uncharacterized protein n=1 Tax=Aquisalinus flavus TaxID=1526572 RepID=A0A8J2V251_9PROT|nr:hypothetical protein [Aquisalinus flavus]MBD0425490.1 hypothetical protein [Aquisalinus flavus]UNE48878.1 hypothetical protein FF099_12865 [Aquisalinus flavus]GGD15674.1 hypothetical protein GCM10011342_25540 [Aquisalinus flavus]